MKTIVGLTAGFAAALVLSACGSGAADTQGASIGFTSGAGASKSVAAHRSAVDAERSSKAAARERVKGERKSSQESSRKAADAELENYGKKVYKEWLVSRGVKSNVVLLNESPGSVQSYLVSAESPATGTAVFTAQLTEDDVDKSELMQAAMAVLQLVGYSDESLARVEIVTADGLVRGVANRRDSPLLAK